MKRNVIALKNKIILDYQQLIKRLNIGYLDDYSNILNMIYLVDLIEMDDIKDYQFISQYYLSR